MRLINARTYRLEEFTENKLPRYAILSHTWGDGEVSYQDMTLNPAVRQKAGFAKIKYTCDQARRDRLEYAWCDTCCIDKSSSAELQEAINSMYRWYANAEECYAYLSDVFGGCPYLAEPQKPVAAPPSDDEAEEEAFWHGAFASSVWFTRGWCLQELLAPKTVKFYGRSWNLIARKGDLAETISKITGVERAVLTNTKPLSEISVAGRMSWAAKRETTRVEDRAYSLLGIFDVNIPLIYGEGGKAFVRLQEEIIKNNADHSIFAWHATGDEHGTLLADSPAAFSSDVDIVSYGRPGSYELTNKGLRVALPILTFARPGGDEYLALLNCRFADNYRGTLALRLYQYTDGNGYYVVPFEEISDDAPLGRLRFVSVSLIADARIVQIIITRDYKFHTVVPSLWLRISPSHIENPKLEPSDRWNSSTKILRPSSAAGRTRGLAEIQVPSGLMIGLVFGYDAPAVSDEGEGRPCGVQAYYVKDSPSALYYSTSSHETGYFSTCLCGGWGHSSCGKTKTVAFLYDGYGQVVLHATINESQVMSETIFIVEVSIHERFELDTIPARIEPQPLVGPKEGSERTVETVKGDLSVLGNTFRTFARAFVDRQRRGSQHDPNPSSMHEEPQQVLPSAEEVEQARLTGNALREGSQNQGQPQL